MRVRLVRVEQSSEHGVWDGSCRWRERLPLMYRAAFGLVSQYSCVYSLAETSEEGNAHLFYNSLRWVHLA